MPKSTPIIDYADRAEKRLPPYERKNLDLKAKVRATGQMYQELEDAGRELLEALGLDLATGNLLDLYGKHLVEDRTALETDDSYRVRLKGAWANKQQSGTPNELLQQYKFFTEATKVQFKPYSASLVNHLTAFMSVWNKQADESQIHDQMLLATQADQDVRLLVVEDNSFTFADSPTGLGDNGPLGANDMRNWRPDFEFADSPTGLGVPNDGLGLMDESNPEQASGYFYDYGTNGLGQAAGPAFGPNDSDWAFYLLGA